MSVILLIIAGVVSYFLDFHLSLESYVIGSAIAVIYSIGEASIKICNHLNEVSTNLNYRIDQIECEVSDIKNEVEEVNGWDGLKDVHSKLNRISKAMGIE